MARLRKPGAVDTPVFIPPSTSKPTRTSPRKATRQAPRYTSQSGSDSEGDDTPFATPQESFLVLKTSSGGANATPGGRKQRVLRPVASNSRLLRQISNESLMPTPDRKQRVQKVERLGGDVGSGRGMYSRVLARSLVKKKAGRAEGSVRVGVESVVETETVVGEEEVEDVEKSVLCGDEEDEDKENVDEVEADEDEDEEDEPLLASKPTRNQLHARRVVSDTEEDESENEEPVSNRQKKASMEDSAPESTTTMSPALTSMKGPHQKGHRTISNWAQEVIDLTNSPEPPVSFMLPPPTRPQKGSFVATSRPTSSASNDVDAMLHFSPTPTKQRSPRKAPPISRPITPPAPISPSKLVSPSKKTHRIPRAPDLRPSIDAFWNPEIVNDWNDKHSPSKPLFSPRKQKLLEQLEAQMNAVTLEDSSENDSDASFHSPTTSPRKTKSAKPERSPTKKAIDSSPSVSAIRIARRAFAAQKHSLATAFLAQLDNTITSGRIAALSHSTGGIHLIWSKTLKTTAGRANWRREALRHRTGPLPSDIQTTHRHHCSIELAEKVIDDEERLYNVLAHEYCHLATFMISGVRTNPHGAEFKSWGRKVSAAFAGRGVEVTTKHSYQIEYRYVWECVDCGYAFKRHSKSVDPKRHSCGKCKGRLVQTKPVPRGGKAGTEGAANEYQVFIKENFKRVKEEMLARGEDVQMGKIMERVAREYREGKERREKSEEKQLEDALEGLRL